VVRLIAGITLANFVAAITSPAYSHLVANGWLGKIVAVWSIACPLLLPLFVGFEVWWMRKKKDESKALWVDAALAVACFLLFCAMLFYALGHHAII
jgi:hypothetical protein